jgi:hypothetical protein
LCTFVVNGLSESDGIALDNGMLEERGVVVGGEIGAIVSAAAFFAGQSGTGH